MITNSHNSPIDNSNGEGELLGLIFPTNETSLLPFDNLTFLSISFLLKKTIKTGWGGGWINQAMEGGKSFPIQGEMHSLPTNSEAV